MLYHNCNKHGVVYLDVSGKIKLLSKIFAIRPDGIKPSNAIVYDSGNVNAPEFFCSECKKTIKKEEISVKCQMCGKDFSLDEVYKVSEVGGVYCLEHCEEYFLGRRKWKLSTIFSKYVAEGEN